MLGERRPDDVGPLEAGEERIDCGDDGVGKRCIRGHEDGDRIRPVLGLADQVGRHHRRVGGGIGELECLAGPGREVDPNDAEHGELGGRDPGVPRTDDLVDCRDRLGSVRQGTNRLSPADRIDLGDAEHVRRSEQRVGQLALGSGGAGNDDLGHAGNLSRDDAHQERRRIGGQSTGGVDPNPSKW